MICNGKFNAFCEIKEKCDTCIDIFFNAVQHTNTILM